MISQFRNGTQNDPFEKNVYEDKQILLFVKFKSWMARVRQDKDKTFFVTYTVFIRSTLSPSDFLCRFFKKIT